MDINSLFGSPAQSGASETALRQKKISLVSYLNTKPLVYGLEEHLVKHAFALQKDVPSVCARRLLDGEVDLGIIPSIEYARARGKLKIVPGLSITSREYVKSVELFFKKDLRKIETIAVDTSSRTSVALLKILMQEKFEISAQYKPMAPDLESMLREADAALIIGDKALHYHAEYSNKLDLAAEWNDLTGLPFVFAFWAGISPEITGEDINALQESYRLGAQNIDTICEKFAKNQPYKASFYADYLNQNISFDFSDKEQEGLLEFYRYAFYYGLIEFIPELNFYGA